MICPRPKHPQTHTHTHTHPQTQNFHHHESAPAEPSQQNQIQIHNLLLAALFLPAPVGPTLLNNSSTSNFPLYKHLTHSMETPTSDIAYALCRILNAPTPQAQLLALRRYFTEDVELVSPLCCISSSPTSRDRVIRAFLFLRIITSGCESRVRRQAFNDVKGKMSLEMEVRPLVRGAGWFGMDGPALPCHVFLEMVRGVGAVGYGECEGRMGGRGSVGGLAAGQGGILGVWRVSRCEVVVQPVDILDALNLTWLARLLYYLSYTFMTCVVILGEVLHIWSTSEISLLGELSTLIQDGLELFFLAPVASAWRVLLWGKDFLFRRVCKVKMDNRGEIFFLKHDVLLIVWRIVRRLVGLVWGVGQDGGAVEEEFVEVGRSVGDTAVRFPLASRHSVVQFDTAAWDAPVQVGTTGRDATVQFGTDGRDSRVQYGSAARDSACEDRGAARDTTVRVGAVSGDGAVRVGAETRDEVVAVGATTKDAESCLGMAVHEVGGKQVGAARVHLSQAL